MSTRPLFVRDADARRNSRIRQANELVRSKQGLTTMQRRLFYIAMAAVNPNAEAFSVTYLPEPLLRELLGGTYGSFKDDLETAAHGLVGTSFRVRKAKGGWSVSSVFHRIEYIHPGEASKEGEINYQPYDLVSVQLHSDLVPYLIGLKGSYNSQVLKVVLELPIARSHKLYELLLHEGFAGKRREVFLPLADLKGYLEVDGEYQKFRDFRRLIDRCRAHIQAVTDQRFNYDGVREGRKITQLRFEVWYETVAQGTLPLVDTQFAIEEIQAASELISVGYTQDAYAAVKAYGVQEVHAVAAEVKAAIKAGRNGSKPIYNPGGLAATRLKERAALASAERELRDQGVLPPEEPEVDISDLAAGLVMSYEDYLSEFAEARWDEFPSNEQEAFMQALPTRVERAQADLMRAGRLSGKGVLILRNRLLLEESAVRPHSLHDWVKREKMLAAHPAEVAARILAVAETKLV